MITGSAHIVSPALTQSLQDYGAYLKKQRADITSTVPPVSKPESRSAIDSGYEKPVASAPSFDVDAIKEAAQERRDSARKAAVYVAGLQQKQKAVDTYMKVSSNNDDNSTRTTSVDPLQIYQESMKYSRRMDLVDAFERAGQQESRASRVNIVI